MYNFIHYSQIPKAAAPQPKEREEDVYKLVSDLIGGGATPKSPTATPAPKQAGPAAAPEQPKQTTPASSGRSKAVKLVVDQLAPVNIRPKVRIFNKTYRIVGIF